MISYVKFAIDRPLFSLFLGLLIAFAAASGIPHIQLKGDYRVFFEEDNPNLQALDAVQDAFSKNDNLGILVVKKEGDLFNPESIRTLWTLTEAAWQTPYSTRVDSIINYQHSTAVNNDVNINALVETPEALPPMDYIKQVVQSEPSLLHRLISADGKAAVINITVSLPNDNQTTAVGETADYVRQLVSTLADQNPELEFHLTGVVALNDSFTRISQADGQTIIPAMFLVVLILLGVLLRSFGAALAALVVILLSILGAMGLGGYFGIPLTNVSIQAPTIIMTIAVADCVHILATYRSLLHKGVTKITAIGDSVRLNLKPVVLTSLTTMIGFLALNFSEAPPFRDLGNLVSMGVAFAMLLSLGLLPALLCLLPVKASIKIQKESRFATLAHFIQRHSIKVILISSVAVVILGSMFPRNELNDEVIKYFGPQTEFRQAVHTAEQHLAGGLDLSVVLDSSKLRGINQPEFLQAVDSVADWLRAQPEVDHVNSLTDITKRLNKNMHGDDIAYYRLPDNHELAAQLLLLYEMSLPFGLELTNLANMDKSQTRLIVSLKNIGSSEQVEFEQRVRDYARQFPVITDVHVTGTGLIFAHIGEDNMQSMVYGTLLALVMIALLLGLSLRSMKLGLISILPNILPVITGYGVWSLVNGQINLALSIVAAVTLGVVVDDTVHFISKFKAALDLRHTPAEAVTIALEQVGKAITVTTLALVAGFSLLMLSSLDINVQFGLSVVIIITLAWLIDLFLLPALLLQFYRHSIPIEPHQAEPLCESASHA